MPGTLTRLFARTNFFACFTAVVLLTGCSGGAQTRSADPRFNAIQVDSSLVLERPLIIAPNRVRVFLHNNYKPWRNQGAYAPHCDLEVWTKHPQRFRVEPDQFRITKVRGGFTPILVRNTRPVQLAANGPIGGLTIAGGGDEGTSFLRSYVELYLKSPRQPDVYRVNCSYMGDPFDVELLSIREIRLALRGTARLVLPGEEEAGVQGGVKEPSATRRSGEAPSTTMDIGHGLGRNRGR